MQCVFHSIRFKVNKGWSTAVLLFYAHTFTPLILSLFTTYFISDVLLVFPAYETFHSFRNIPCFDIDKGKDYLYYGQNIFTRVHTGDRLEVTIKEKEAIVHKLPAQIFPEYFLIRMNEFNKVAATPLEEWSEY